MKILLNFGDEKWCTECKNKIREGKKYAVIPEEIYGDEIIEKEYHLSCIPVSEDSDDEMDICCDPLEDFVNNDEDFTEGLY